MRKHIVAIAIIISTIGSTVTFSADDFSTRSGNTTQLSSTVPVNQKDKWVAKDPYEGTVYQKEYVSRMNKLVNYSASIGSEIYMMSYIANYVYSNSELIPFQPNVPLLSNLLSLSYPTVSTVGYLSLGAAALVLSLPANMGITYGAKKGAQVVGHVMTYGWDVFKYGFNTLNYQFNHLRAKYLQGTIWANNHVKYENKDDKNS